MVQSGFQPTRKGLAMNDRKTRQDLGRRSSDRSRKRRLQFGRVEYVLLGLIALSIAVTLAMAVVNPSE
jgi:hypothetical protein